MAILSDGDEEKDDEQEEERGCAASDLKVGGVVVLHVFHRLRADA
jgi:hypothetical protein